MPVPEGECKALSACIVADPIQLDWLLVAFMYCVQLHYRNCVFLKFRVFSTEYRSRNEIISESAYMDTRLKTNNAQLYSTNVNFQKLRFLETNSGDSNFEFPSILKHD